MSGFRQGELVRLRLVHPASIVTYTDSARTRSALGAGSNTSGIPKFSHAISRLNYSTALFTVIADILQECYAVGSTTYSEGPNQLDERLRKWHASLPRHLTIDLDRDEPAVVPPPHVISLHIQYNVSLILLHRPNLDTETSSSGISRLICNMAATSINV